MIKRIVMLGAPGSGKGTWSKILSDTLSLPHISSGDLFRHELAIGSDLGKKVRHFLDNGLLVPDDVTIALVEKTICEGKGRDGFILDGFPRTIAQAEALGQFLSERDLSLDAVIDLVVDEAILIERTLARLICTQCGQPYNALSMVPMVEGVCDVCGGPVIRRSDDTEETLKKRFKAYYEQTEPLISYYREQGLLVEFFNTSPPDEATKNEMLKLLGLADESR